MRDKIVALLAEQIGVEPGDIQDQDNLRDDLHIGSADLAEISEKLAELGYEHVDFSEVRTVEQLLAEISDL